MVTEPLPAPAEALENGGQVADSAPPRHPISKLIGLFAKQPENGEGSLETPLEGTGDALPEPVRDLEMRVH